MIKRRTLVHNNSWIMAAKIDGPPICGVTAKIDNPVIPKAIMCNSDCGWK
jgi:hypothetical protein